MHATCAANENNIRTARDAINRYKKLAQWLGRSEDTFLDFDVVFRVAMEYEAPDDVSDDASTSTDVER
jgi:hypothetical protein